MARTRYLKPGFFANDRLAEFGPWHRLLFAGLWTLADSSGRLEDRPKRIKGALFPFDDVDVDQMLDDLSRGDDPFVVRYRIVDTAYINIPKFLTHQRPHGKEPASTIPPPVYAKTGAKTQSRGKDVTSPTNSASSPTNSASSPTLTFNGEWGMGNGERGMGNGEPAQDAPVAPMRRRTPTLLSSPLAHAKCYPSGACARGLCVPRFLGDQWVAQVSGDTRRVDAFVEAQLAAVTGPVGDDPLAWWRAAWRRQHGGTTAPQGRPTQGSRLQQVHAEVMALHTAPRPDDRPDDRPKPVRQIVGR